MGNAKKLGWEPASRRFGCVYWPVCDLASSRELRSFPKRESRRVVDFAGSHAKIRRGSRPQIHASDSTKSLGCEDLIGTASGTPNLSPQNVATTPSS